MSSGTVERAEESRPGELGVVVVVVVVVMCAGVQSYFPADVCDFARSGREQMGLCCAVVKKDLFVWIYLDEETLERKGACLVRPDGGRMQSLLPWSSGASRGH